MEDNDFEAVLRRLDGIMAVLMNHDKVQAMNLNEKVMTLSGSGLKDSEVARVLGLKDVTVRSIKSKAKKKR